MKNIENQFGLFDNNLETQNQNIKTAVSEALETKEAKEKIELGEGLSLGFIFQVVENLKRITGDDYNKMIDYEKIIYPKILKEVKEILDFLKVKHVFDQEEYQNDKDSDTLVNLAKPRVATQDKKNKKEVGYINTKSVMSGSHAQEKWEEENEK